MHHTIFFGLIALNFGTSSGSSSDGVGKTLNGVLVELFLGVLADTFAGVSVTPTAAVDFLFLGDDRAASS
jgi:hypothetical protein